MFRRIVASLALVPMLLTASPVHAQAAVGCRFILGFRTLHDMDPADIGDCADNQAFAANGDAQQHTSKGLMAWRKIDNWTAFTNGYMTWINGPNGLQGRLNTQRFTWEANPDGLFYADKQETPKITNMTGQAVDWNEGDTPFRGVVESAWRVASALVGLDGEKSPPPPTGAAYIAIWLSVANKGTQTAVVSDSALMLEDDQGRSFTSVLTPVGAEMVLGQSPAIKTTDESTGPGLTDTYVFVYVVPKGATGLKLLPTQS